MRPSVFILLIVGSLIVLAPRPVAAQTSPAANASEPAWLTPKLVKAPEYPSAMIERKQASEVDAVIRITKDGRLKEIVSVRSMPKAEEAEAALKSKLADWTFRAEMAADCTPCDAEGVVRVWFDLDGGRPIVSVAKPKGRSWLPSPPANSLNPEEVRQVVNETFPRNARDSTIGATVVVAIEVNGDTGVPIKSKSTFVELDWDMGDSPLTAYYAEGAEKAAMATRYPPLPAYVGRSWHSCTTINYRFIRGTDRESLRSMLKFPPGSSE